MSNRFKKGVGVISCESCGRKTRPPADSNLPYCKECIIEMERENQEADA